MHAESLINDTAARDRRHLGSPQRVPCGLHILAQPGLDGRIVLWGVYNVALHALTNGSIAFLDARSPRGGGEPRVAGRDLPPVHPRAAHDLALFLVRPHVLLQVNVVPV